MLDVATKRTAKLKMQWLLVTLNGLDEEGKQWQIFTTDETVEGIEKKINDALEQ